MDAPWEASRSRSVIRPKKLATFVSDVHIIFVDGLKMEIGIVGAGIAGLASAIALRRSGHNVEVSDFAPTT